MVILREAPWLRMKARKASTATPRRMTPCPMSTPVPFRESHTRDDHPQVIVYLDGGEARVVPAIDQLLLHEPRELSLRQLRLHESHPRERLDLYTTPTHGQASLQSRLRERLPVSTHGAWYLDWAQLECLLDPVVLLVTVVVLGRAQSVGHSWRQASTHQPSLGQSRLCCSEPAMGGEDTLLPRPPSAPPKSMQVAAYPPCCRRWGRRSRRWGRPCTGCPSCGQHTRPGGKPQWPALSGLPSRGLSGLKQAGGTYRWCGVGLAR